MLAGAVGLIAHDLTATLGWGHARAQAEARDALGNRMQFPLDGLAWEQLDPATRQEVLGDLVVEAVEDLQQRLHDTFVDTTWPGVPAPPAASAVAWGRRPWRDRVVLPAR